MFLSSPVPDAGGEDKTTGASIAGFHRECFIVGHTPLTGCLGSTEPAWEVQSWAGCKRQAVTCCVMPAEACRDLHAS